jgi:hypothetical protein
MTKQILLFILILFSKLTFSQNLNPSFSDMVNRMVVHPPSTTYNNYYTPNESLKLISEINQQIKIIDSLHWDSQQQINLLKKDNKELMVKLNILENNLRFIQLGLEIFIIVSFVILVFILKKMMFFNVSKSVKQDSEIEFIN